MFRKEMQEEPRTHSVRASSVSLSKQSFFDDFPNIVPVPGTMLVRTRAISARVNKNYDGFPSSELKAAYKSFIGRPSFVNHQNLNFRQTRGIVRGAVYKEAGPDKYIDLAIEIDARAYPKLAAEIEAGRIDGVSMGCFLPGTLISMADGSQQVIEKIEIDDEIITHNSNVEPVTYVMRRDYNGTVYRLETFGEDMPLWLTSEHPVWVRKESSSAYPQWVVAADIKANDWVLTPTKALISENAHYVKDQTYPYKDGLWRRVVSNTDYEYEGVVFNLDVDGDDSYVAGQIAVHNCDVKQTVCSFCENVARDPYEFCSHILYHKGQVLERVNENFEKEAVLVYERCEGVNFFEISFVFDPADETALVQEVYVPGGYRSSSASYEYDVVPKIAYDDTIAPPDVDTMRHEKQCPLCEDKAFDGEKCQLCGYVAPPDELQPPDLERAKQMDIRQQQRGDSRPPLDRQARRNLSRDPFIRRS